MYFTLGQRARTGDVVDLLLACHHRIREHLALARRIATARADTPHDSIAAAAARVRSYFGIAFPLHRDDEEVDIFPRLAHRSAEVDAALARLVQDHAQHDQAVTTVVSLCEALEREPSKLAAHAADLARALQALEGELDAHTRLEEAVVFPAIEQMSAQEREEIHACMRKRRSA